jgi:hypothetical protein
VNGVTFDAGALVALERNDREMWAALKRLAIDGTPPTVPTVVLSQVWRDGARQANLARALKHCHLEPLSEELAREAGELCQRSHTADIVDAVVVVSAARRSDIIITSDRGDLQHLADELTSGAVVVLSV